MALEAVSLSHGSNFRAIDSEKPEILFSAKVIIPLPSSKGDGIGEAVPSVFGLFSEK
ncbi:hypothetical protein [Rufibacter quisquiliarum]|uniref:hypothetical protein n=1 Tax=Rufibacter quisquiliarum TaxID=1549639 RepID=UPI0015FC8929|nr:hypothetical protein [Rufibacter quisquiliarum]